MNNFNDLTKTEHSCNHCSDSLWFDGTGCFCVNKDCIVYNKYALKIGGL